MSFLATPAGRWLVILLVAIAAMAAAYWHGREYEQGVVAQRELVEEQAFSKRLLEKAAEDRARHAKVAADLAKERKARDADKRAFDKKLAEVPRESIVEVCTAGSAPAGGANAAGSAEAPAPILTVPRITAVGCSLWNDALAAGATVAERSGWIAGANPCADSAAPQ